MSELLVRQHRGVGDPVRDLRALLENPAAVAYAYLDCAAARLFLARAGQTQQSAPHTFEVIRWAELHGLGFYFDRRRPQHVEVGVFDRDGNQCCIAAGDPWPALEARRL